MTHTWTTRGFEAFSAGTEPGEVDPRTLDALEHLRDLFAKLAARDEHQPAGHSALSHGVACLLQCLELVEQGEHVGEGLAAAGLGHPEQGLAAEERRDAGLLDVRRPDDSLLFEGADQARKKCEG